ncbi:MAG: EF-hand domain-containing protein [Planctomycetota bacterium]
MLSATILAVSLFLVAADVQPGDKVVTLTTAPVMSGSEKLAEAEPGVELTVAGVKLPWVGVTVTQDGKEVKGWVLDKNLLINPESAFAALLGHCGNTQSRPDFQNEFQKIDANGNGSIMTDEFSTATKLDSVADLNQQLQRRLTDLRKTITIPDPRLRSQGILFFLAGELSSLKGLKREISFNGWRRLPTHDEATRMAEDFLRSGDIRRSRLAQELLDREDPKVRARRAEVLFRWADSNGDGALSLEEFKQALPQAEQAAQ